MGYKSVDVCVQAFHIWKKWVVPSMQRTDRHESYFIKLHSNALLSSLKINLALPK